MVQDAVDVCAVDMEYSGCASSSSSARPWALNALFDACTNTRNEVLLVVHVYVLRLGVTGSTTLTT